MLNSGGDFRARGKTDQPGQLHDSSEGAPHAADAVRLVAVRQQPFLLRAEWFLVLGWWLSAVWMVLAYALRLTIIGMPIWFWMFDRALALLTLHNAT